MGLSAAYGRTEVGEVVHDGQGIAAGGEGRAGHGRTEGQGQHSGEVAALGPALAGGDGFNGLFHWIVPPRQ